MELTRSLLICAKLKFYRFLGYSQRSVCLIKRHHKVSNNLIKKNIYSTGFHVIGLVCDVIYKCWE